MQLGLGDRIPIVSPSYVNQVLHAFVPTVTRWPMGALGALGSAPVCCTRTHVHSHIQTTYKQHTVPTPGRSPTPARLYPRPFRLYPLECAQGAHPQRPPRPLFYFLVLKTICECAAASRLTIELRAASCETHSPRRQRASCADRGENMGKQQANGNVHICSSRCVSTPRGWRRGRSGPGRGTARTPSPTTASTHDGGPGSTASC